MYVEVLGTLSPRIRRGERLTLRAQPLRVGTSRNARLRVLDKEEGADLELLADERGARLSVPLQGLRCSVNGVGVDAGTERALSAGEVLYVHPGLVLEVREGPRVRARSNELEAGLRTGDDAAWAVYRDFLEERGDPLASWLARASQHTSQDRLAALGGLADAVVAGLVSVQWSARGMLETVEVSRQATVGAPGLQWFIEQLDTVAVARVLGGLRLAQCAGDGHDAECAAVLDLLATLGFVGSLRELSLGFCSFERAWPLTRTALLRLRQVATQLPAEVSALIRPGGHASLQLVGLPRGLDVVGVDLALNPSRSDVGTADGCLVRIVGEAAPVACTLHRETDGQWVVFDEGADPFRPTASGRNTLRVNGRVVARALLQPGDLIEPVTGLTLRFTVSSRR